ncbi:MAG: helix-turn-helix domain-containing protein [Muricoprocola sp.]
MNRVEEMARELLKEEESGIEVRKSGSYRFLPSYRYEAHKHIEYEINYVLQGKCMMIFDTEYVPLKAGECIVIAPFRNHGFLVDAKTGCKIQQTEMTIRIPEEMKEVFGLGSKDLAYQVLKNCEDLIQIMEQISRFYRTDKEEYGTALLHLAVVQLVVALGYHGKKTDAQTSGIRNEKIRDIMKYIQEHYQEPLQIEELAASRGISSRFLRRYFTEEIGMSCLDYIQALRLNKAKELLWETRKSITEIAMETGYGTAQYFSRVFREEIGMTPTAYRSTWKENKK